MTLDNIGEIEKMSDAFIDMIDYEEIIKEFQNQTKAMLSLQKQYYETKLDGIKNKSIKFITTGLQDLDELTIISNLERDRALMKIEDNHSETMRRHDEIRNIG